MQTRLLCAVLLAYAAAILPAQSVLPAPAQVLRLDDVVRLALERNPEAQGALHTVKALEHHLPQATALPDPSIAIGWAGNPAPFSIMSRDASSYRGVTLSEQFPARGKLKLQGEMANKDVEAAKADYDAVCRRVGADLKAAFYDYFYFDKAIQATNKNKALLEKLSAIAEAQYRVGQSSQQDVLRSQVEISMLIEKLTMLQLQKDTAQARINAYLQQPVDTPLPPAEELQPSPLRFTFDELSALAAKNDTAVQRDQTMIDKQHLGVALAQKQYRPDIGVSYMYQQRADQPDMNGLTVSVNIPVFYKTKQRPAIAEASENALSAQKARDNRLNEIHFELRQQYLALKAAERLMSLYRTGIVPQSSLALESSMSAYQVGKTDFFSLLTNFKTVLDYQSNYFRQLADYNIAIARIESLTGVEIASPESPTLAAPQIAGKGL
jgi:outer membrane protein TolC